MPEIDFAAHAASMGAVARKAASIAELERALKEAEKDERTSVIVIDTDPLISHRRRRPLVGCRGARGFGAPERPQGAQGL